MIVGKYQDNMPVILEKKDENKWLNPDIIEAEKLHPLLKPFHDADGYDNVFNHTRRLAYSEAETRWVKLQTNNSIGVYDTILAISKLPEPVWPEEPTNIIQALEIAFKDKIIDDCNHPVLKKLRGEL